ncbi:MAG: DUF6600 domain-containing protein [Gallionellaceae bacterium]
MSNPSRFLALTGVLLFLLCTASARADYADPPERVARLDNTQGQVSYSPAGENEWFGVVRNRPLIRGDRLWTDYDARAEFQVGSAAVRIGSNTSVEILDLDDNIAQFQVTQGTLDLSVRHMYTGQVFEVDTPTLTFTINQAGRYRIDVDPGNNATTIGVWEGAGEAYGENANFPLLAGDTVGFYSTDLRDHEMYGVPPEDDFDRYCLERDRLLTRSASLRYLDDDVVGYADLDEYGSWRPVRSYGTVWFPSRVEADWAPYRDGHWVWQEPWGWTWVDDAPWGFAPSHYGRWVYVSHRWGWIPGPRHVRPVYAPALVAFVSDRGWGASLSLGGGTPIGWFPLGPREVYVPSYQASRDYFTRVNVNNTAVNNTSIINVYNNYSSGTINVNHVTYANRTVAGAITVVSSTVFVNAQPVRPAAIRLDRMEIASGEITRIAPIAPSVRSVIGAGKAAQSRPSREAFDRQVFVRNAPPPVERPFAAREQQLQKNPGRPLEPRAINSLQSRDTSTLPNVHVIGEQRGAVDARAAGSRRSGERPSATPGQLRPLDRSTAPGSRSGPVTGGQTLDKANKGQSDTQQQLERKRQIDTQQQELRQRKADSEQQAAKQQQLERQRLIDTQQQELRQRKADSEQQAAKQQQLERQRLIDTQQEQRQRQAAPQQEQRQGQRQAAQPQQERAAKTPQELQAECERQAILQHRDPQQCRSKTQPQPNPNNPNGDKNRN